MQKLRSLCPPTIRDALNALAAGRPAGPDEPASCGPPPPDIARWIGIDSDILWLYKAYLDARAGYLGTLVAHGKDAPLSEIAADMADSAWCALETRIYELQMDAAALARADLTRRLAEEDAHDKTLRAQRDRAAREREAIRDLASRQRRAETDRQRRDFFLFWYWCQFVIDGRGDTAPSSLNQAFAGA